MSEDINNDIPKITTVEKKEGIKDPKRVALGKQLAKISKAAKERKMREKIYAENREKINSENNGFGINYGFVFGAIGAVAAIVSLYYTGRGYIREISKVEEDKALEPNIVVVKNKPPKTSEKLDTFD